MYATERQDAIESLLAVEGRVSVIDLAGRFAVTTETVRRDLAQLESIGALRRVHGGAVVGERGSTAEPSLTERVSRHSSAKSAIGARALDLLGEGFRGSLFIDAGTTTAAFADRLAPRLSAEPIQVVTHALTIAHTLSATPNAALTLIGGKVRGLTAAAVGADTVRAIDQMRPDVAVLGTNGISSRLGLSTPDPEEAAVKRAIVRSARRVVVVADAEKHGRELLVAFAPLTAIDVLVTDAAPDTELADALGEAGVEVWLP